ncbi:MAG TPA: DUF2490 domain-containing protein [Flavobacteriales bacterium]|nr:DUF2490 domain-containing protein [Flavobacteriales bacterium]
MKTKLAIVFVMIASFAPGQNVSYYGIFPAIDHSAGLSKRFSYNVFIFDALKPYKSTINGFEDEAWSFYFYTEAGLSYSINSKLSFTASYVYERQNTFNTYYRNENRLFQQLTLKLPIGKAELKQRLRFDERFVQNRITREAPLTHRLRYLAGIKTPFSDKLYGFAYTEFFFNTTPGAQNVLNENWSAAQMGIKLNTKNNFETGLLYVGWINNAQKDMLYQFYLQVTWVNNLDFSNKK